MTSGDVTTFYRQIQALGIGVWIDGGWGVDALLGKQTRPHVDLDIVIEEEDCGLVVRFLKDQGFREVPRDDSRPCNFVMGNSEGKEVDFHVIVLDADGDGLYGAPEAIEGMYPAAALQGWGSVDGVPVRCTSPEFQMGSHTGYEFDEADAKDVIALADKFELAIPQDYLEACTKSDRKIKAFKAT